MPDRLTANLLEKNIALIAASAIVAITKVKRPKVAAIFLLNMAIRATGRCSQGVFLPPQETFLKLECCNNFDVADGDIDAASGGGDHRIACRRSIRVVIERVRGIEDERRVAGGEFAVGSCICAIVGGVNDGEVGSGGERTSRNVSEPT